MAGNKSKIEWENKIANTTVESNVLANTYHFKWIINDISKRFSGELLDSGPFYPVSQVGMSARLIFSSPWQFSLYKCNSKYDFNFKCQLIISDIAKKKEIHISEFEKKFSVADEWCPLNQNIIVDAEPTDTVELHLLMLLTVSTTKELNQIPSIVDCVRAFVSDLAKLYHNKTAADVSLQTESDSVNVHKAILCARSPVFAKMFQQDMSEAQRQTVEIEDIGMPALRVMLDYMYAKRRLHADFETSLEVYYAADKYEVPQLKEIYRQVLISKLTTGTAGQLMLFADRHSDPQLKAKVVEFINGNLKACFREPWWDELKKEHLNILEEIMNS